MARFPFFPSPEQGELVFSGFCRCAESTGTQATDLLFRLTGQRHHAPISAPLPTCLFHISEHLPVGHVWCNVEDTILNHTIFPYLTFFLRPEVAKEALTRLASESDANSVSGFLGLSEYRSTVHHTRILWCSQCGSDDQRAFGFSYFHREHQIPGVFLCWKHGILLNRGCSVCGSYPIPHTMFSLPGTCGCKSRARPWSIEEIPASAIDSLFWIALASADLLRVKTTDRHRRIILANALDTTDFRRGSLPDYQAIASALNSRFGAECLEFLGYPALRTDGRPSPWVPGCLRVSREERRIATLPLMLLTGLVFETMQAFAQGNNNLPRTGAASSSPKTPFGADTQHAMGCESAYAVHSVTARVPKSGRHDLSKLDARLASAIRVRSQQMRVLAGRPVRISKAALLKYFGQLSRLTGREPNFPKTLKVLATVTENQSEFTKRKIVWALQELARKNRTVSMNVLRRIASTTPQNLIEHREEVAETARKLNLAIDERSVFNLERDRPEHRLAQ